MRTQKRGHRLLAMVLTLVMAMSLAVPAYAAGTDEAYVSINVDGREVYASSRESNGTKDVLTAGARELDVLSVNDQDVPKSVWAQTAASAASRYVNGYDSADGLYRVYTEIVNGVRVVRINWTGLKTGLIVDAESTIDGEYVVKASATPSASCSVSEAEATVAANDRHAVEFTPGSGRVEIRALDIYVNGTRRNVAVPLTGSTVVSVGGQDIEITVLAGGAVRAVIEHVTADTVLTAQVYNAATRFALNVVTDGYVDSDVSSEAVESGAARRVTLTPKAGYNVGDVVITVNGRSATIGFTSSEATLNGVTYSLDRRMDGRAVLTIPMMNADVDVDASASLDGARVEVITSSNISCDKAGVNVIDMNRPFAVRFNAKRDAVLATIKITTAAGTFKASSSDDYIVVNGKYFPIYRNTAGDVTINFTQVPGNMTIEVVGRDTVHDVKVTTDSRVEADFSRTDVDDGEDMDVTFKLKSGSTDSKIRQIRVTYDGKTYRADPSEAKYVTVAGERWYFRFDGSSVTLEMTNIEYDVAVYASTVRSGNSGSGSSGDGSYRITKNPDTHSNVSFTGRQPFEDGDDTDIRVYTDKGYVLKSVRLTVNGRTGTFNPFDSTVKVDGETYDITWKSNMDCTIDINGIYSNITVNATSVKGTEKYPSGSSGNSGSNGDWTITVKPSEPTTPSIPSNDPNTSLGVNGYHKAYMYGFGDNTFRPDQSMTRAQTIAILCRLYSGIADSDFKAYASNPGFQDVNPGSTFAGYIGYAKQQGYLAAIVGSGLLLQPNKAITRAEFCTLLCAFTNQNLVGVSTASRFGDVPSSHWAVVYVNYCAERSWVLGYGNGLFQPDASLTRAQMCVIVNRINSRAVANTSIGYNLRSFNDVPTSHWAYADIMEASHNHNVKSVVDGVETWAV